MNYCPNVCFMPIAHGPILDKKSEWKSVRVRWLLLRYKIAPIFSQSCLRQKIGPCALTSVREKIGVTSSNNETSPIIVTHNSSDKKKRSVCADFWSEKKSVRFFLGAACDKKSVVCADSVREKCGPSLRLFLGAPYDKKSVRVRWALSGNSRVRASGSRLRAR